MFGVERRIALGVLLALSSACESASSTREPPDDDATTSRNEQAQADAADGGGAVDAGVVRADAGAGGSRPEDAGSDTARAGRGSMGVAGASASGGSMQAAAGMMASACDPARCPTIGAADACCLNDVCSSDYGMGCGVLPPADMTTACVRDRCLSTSAGPGCCASAQTCGVNMGGMCISFAPASGTGCAALTDSEIAAKCDPLPQDCMYRETENCATPLELTGLLKACSAPYDECPSATDVLPIGSGSPCEYVVSGSRAVAGRCCYVTRERFCPK